jgi:hypothetical protein
MRRKRDWKKAEMMRLIAFQGRSTESFGTQE